MQRTFCVKRFRSTDSKSNRAGKKNIIEKQFTPCDANEFYRSLEIEKSFLPIGVVISTVDLSTISVKFDEGDYQKVLTLLSVYFSKGSITVVLKRFIERLKDTPSYPKLIEAIEKILPDYAKALINNNNSS